MAYLPQATLTSAWVGLSDRLGRVAIPLALFRSPQNPAAPFLQTYAAWEDRLDAEYDEDGKRVRPLSVAELEAWTTKLADAQALLVKLEAQYPQQAPLAPSKPPVSLKEEQITGALPWWYWPLRVGAGVAAGWFTFRILRPTSDDGPGFEPALAGVGSFRSRMLRELEDMLERRGYDPRDARKLQKEGMGPEELAERLRVRSGAPGSLEYTHRLKKVSG